jgi:hypothetical protein
MNEQEKTLAAYKEYLLECANNDSLDFTAINNKYEHCCNSTPDKGWYSMYDGTVIDIDTDILFRHKKRTVVVNGKAVPAPMDREPKHGENYYFLSTSRGSIIDFEQFSEISTYDKRAIRAGWFDNEQDASEYFKALLGIK